MRLIDADAVLRIVESYGTTHGTSLGRHSGVADTIYDEIVKLPTIEAEPVRHGEWEPKPPEKKPGFGDIYFAGLGYRCSKCYYDDDAAIRRTKYCPNCGAKMGGGDV